MREKDLVDTFFGKLKVIKRINRNNKSFFVLCRCICGNEKVYRTDRLRSRKDPTCGCEKYDFKVGDKKGKFLILENLGKIKKNIGRGSRAIYWLCKCECGKQGKYTSTYIAYKNSRGCISCYQNSMIGKKFGKLTILEKLDKKINNTVQYKCLCQCSLDKTNIVYLELCKMTTGHTSSCGCNRIGNTSFRWNGVAEIGGYYFNKIENGARKRNIDYNISRSFLWDLFIEQNKKCALTKIDLNFAPTKKRVKEGNASLDRINSNKNYTENNVQWVHKTINKMKQDLDQDVFVAWCHLVASNNPLPKDIEL